MAGETKMFRKSALEKLSSPERLDVMMQITSPAGWLALTALGFVIVLIVLWSIFGSIPTKVAGQGILIRGGAILAVTSDTSGRLSAVSAAPGQLVEAGDVVARVSQEDLLLRIENRKSLLADLQRQSGTLATGGMERQLREKIASQQQLVSRGLLTRGSLMATQEELASLQRQSAGRSNEISQVRREISELENSLANASKVVTPYSGRVLEMVASVGELIRPGSRIFTLEELDAQIETILYVPATEGKKITPGMEVRVSPSTVKKEEYGFMKGKVTKVSDFPMTPDGLMRVLRNENLVQQLAGSGAPIEVRVALIPDETTQSKFKWSSSKGPPTSIYSGTIVQGEVVVAKKRPISMVLPILKNAVGAN